jgi:type I restriction enzyme M protein
VPGRRRRENTDIDHSLYPQLADAGIPLANLRRNISTSSSGRMRGDLWIATVPDSDPAFEQRIVALLECKDHFTDIGDADWQDAMEQGRTKSVAQGLSAYFVTNTGTLTRCYNAADMSEVSLDGNLITRVPGLPILRAIQTQVGPGVSDVTYESFTVGAPDPKRFRASLWNLRQIFRSRGISRGSEDSMIKTSLTFCILKLVTEQQRVARTLPETVFLWDDWRPGQMSRDIVNTIDDITALPEFQHLSGCLAIDDRLDSQACVRIHTEIGQYHLYGSDFDFFGLIYESLANKQLKRDFGEFYTPRHIIRTMVRLRLAEEQRPRRLTVCDPACGTGGFLVEALLYLQRTYAARDTLDEEVVQTLKEETFYGFDTNSQVAIAFARTNMMMAGNSGANILETRDSLIDLPEGEYDYVLANVPYGQYDGMADISQFAYTNARRYELLFVEKIVRALKPGGRAAVIVPDGLIEATSYASYRHKLLCDVTLEAVVSLPPFVFEPYTTEKTYVLFLTRRRPAEQGVLQETAIWQYVVDNDGFQAGKKRYVIADNDLPELEAGFLSLELEGKAGFVEMAQVCERTYYSFCSEFYLRRAEPIEVSLADFESIIERAELLVGDIGRQD